MKSKSRDFYQLKADLISVEFEAATNKLVLVFDKKSNGKLSEEKLSQLKGFLVVSFKRPGDTSKDKLLKQ